MAEGSAAAGGGSGAPNPFDAAFEAALDAQGAGGEGAVEGADGEETTTGEEDEGGENDSDTTTDDDQTAADASEEVQSDETSTGKGEDEGDEPPAVADETPKLKALRGKIDEAKTPEERSKAIQKYMDAALQPKFQQISATRKFVEAFKKNPVAAARQVLAEAAKKGLVTEEGEAPTGEEAELKATLKAAGFTDQQTDVVTSLLRPMQQQQSELALKNLASEVDNDLASFKKDYPDFDDLEPKMSEIMDTIIPAPGTNRRQYLEMIRTIALGQKGVAKGVKKALKGVVENAKGAAPKTRAVPDSSVQPGRQGRPLTFEESVELAMQGKRVGRGISR